MQNTSVRLSRPFSLLSVVSLSVLSADLSAQSAESLDIRSLSEEKRVVRAFPVDGQGIGESDIDAVADAFPGQDEFVSLAFPAFEDQGSIFPPNPEEYYLRKFRVSCLILCKIYGRSPVIRTVP